MCVWLISHRPWTSAHQNARAHDWAIEEKIKKSKKEKKVVKNVEEYFKEKSTIINQDSENIEEVTKVKNHRYINTVKP